MAGCHAWHSMNLLSLLRTDGMKMDFSGYLYHSVSVTCTFGKNGGLIKVNFVSEFCAEFYDCKFLCLI
jgi:hypothetical protein